MSATVRILLKRRAELHDGMQDSQNINDVKSGALALHCGVSNDGLSRSNMNAVGGSLSDVLQGRDANQCCCIR